MQSQNNGQVDQAMIQAMRQFKTKIKNAYIVIYDRVETYDMAKVKDVIDDPKTITMNSKELAKLYQTCKVPSPSSQAQVIQTIPQIPHNVHDLILAKNKKFWLSKTIFSTSFIKEMLEILRTTVPSEDRDYKKYSDPSLDVQQCEPQSELESLRFLVTFFLTVAVRSAEKLNIPFYV
jgi:hypothetical protein